MKYISEPNKKSVYKTYMIYFIAFVAFVGVRISSALGMLNGLSDNAIDIIYSTLIEVICLFVLPMILYCVMLKVKPRQLFNTCNFYKINFKTVIISLALGIVLYVVTIMTSTLFNGIITMFGFRSGGGSGTMTLGAYITQIFTTALLPAFCEEFLHRGMCLQGTKHIGFHKAIIISSILFGLIHLNIVQVFYAIILGVIIGYISVISKNIWPAIIVHFVNNFISITNTFLMDNNASYNNFVTNVYSGIYNMNFFLLVLSIIIGSILLIFVLYLLLKKLYENTMIRKVEQAINTAYNKGNPTSDAPIVYDSNEIKQLVESTTKLNLDFNSIKNPIDIFMPKQDKIYKAHKRDYIFLIVSVLLGTIITVSTFIWGLM
ncbi:MAG: CPBP family intramembrane metalloprotease [Clostridiales bacterium]|nr:CPBP family intramembrane metalloprotease [Clostridiales bacterium]